jgi:hypothetical protein
MLCGNLSDNERLVPAVQHAALLLYWSVASRRVESNAARSCENLTEKGTRKEEKQRVQMRRDQTKRHPCKTSLSKNSEEKGYFQRQQLPCIVTQNREICFQSRSRRVVGRRTSQKANQPNATNAMQLQPKCKYGQTPICPAHPAAYPSRVH